MKSPSRAVQTEHKVARAVPAVVGSTLRSKFVPLTVTLAGSSSSTPSVVSSTGRIQRCSMMGASLGIEHPTRSRFVAMEASTRGGKWDPWMGPARVQQLQTARRLSLQEDRHADRVSLVPRPYCWTASVAEVASS